MVEKCEGGHGGKYCSRSLQLIINDRIGTYDLFGEKLFTCIWYLKWTKIQVRFLNFTIFLLQKI